MTCEGYLLYHDTIDAHVLVAPGEVEYVHPAESKTQHQEAEVLIPPKQVEPSGDQEEDTLQKTISGSTVITINMTAEEFYCAVHLPQTIYLQSVVEKPIFSQKKHNAYRKYITNLPMFGHKHAFYLFLRLSTLWIQTEYIKSMK